MASQETGKSFCHCYTAPSLQALGSVLLLATKVLSGRLVCHPMLRWQPLDLQTSPRTLHYFLVNVSVLLITASTVRSGILIRANVSILFSMLILFEPSHSHLSHTPKSLQQVASRRSFAYSISPGVVVAVAIAPLLHLLAPTE